MAETYLTDLTFDKSDFTVDTLEKGEYENCVFSNCNFANSNLSEFKFIDCTFRNCDLSLVKLNKTTLQDIQFENCKMLGMRFDTCNPFGLALLFEGCQLNHSSFYKLKIAKTRFLNTQLVECDFTESDLTGSIFTGCNLSQAVFDHSNLQKADFRTAVNFSIDPESNQLKKAKFSLVSVSGLLDKYDIEIDV
ncbi:MAG TPA: pentapeptide repeat-containing protein [Bacteroidia bacterium]|nr:pentapeptide repeat-containing protein [Bacteroidia bacterium]